jgi:uncharacterized repeat protein (TIGR01451 family)
MSIARARNWVSAIMATSMTFASTVVLADVGINKGFNPISVSVGQTSALTVTVLNTNASDATGTSLTDNLPPGMVIATPPGATTTCVPGTVNATSGATSVSLTGATIPAATAIAGTCSFSVNVISAAAGTYVNTIPASAVTSSQGTNVQGAQATLTVVALAPVSASKAFSLTTVHGNGSASRLTITLPNSNGVALTNVAITDTLPVTVAIATPANAATTCVPGNVTTTATAVSLSGATLPAAGSCTFSVDVIAADPTTFFNNTSTNSVAANAMTSDQGVSNNAFSNTIRVQTGAQVTKAFSPSTITNGTNSTLTITFANFNASTLTPITFTDNLPAAVTAIGPVSTTCGGGTAAFTATTVSITGGSLNGVAPAAGNTSMTCTLSVTVTGTNAGSSAITATNPIPAGNFGGIKYPASSANLIINPTSTVTGSKSFSGAAVQTGVVTMTVTLNNTTGTPANITSFTDALTTMGSGYTVALSPAATTTCAGGTVNATPGTTSITMTSGVIPANGFCTIVVPVQIGPTASTGNRTNTIPAGAIVTDRGNNLVAITGNLNNVAAALTVAKAFAPSTVFAGQNSTLTVTLTRTANASALTNIALTDTLPAGHTIATTPNASTTCTGGAVTAVSGGNTVSLSGASLAGGAAATSCTITVSVTTPSGSAGAATNTIAAATVTTTEGVTNNSAASATITRVTSFVSLSKGFSPNVVAIGGTSLMSVQILNNNPGAINLTNVSLTDNLPVGMLIAATPNATFTGGGCSGGAITATAGTPLLAITGATVNANAVCLLSVKVSTTAAGNLVNSVSANNVTSAQGVTNLADVSATLAATGNADLTISKDDGVAQVIAGGTTTYTIIAGNNGPNDVAGATVTDTPPPGMTFLSWTCTSSPGSFCLGGGAGAISTLVSVKAGGNATFIVVAAIASNATGLITNRTTIAAPGTVVDVNTTNNSAADTDVIVPQADLAATKTAIPNGTYLPGQSLSYLITVTNNGPSDVTGVTVNDAVPASVTVINWTCSAVSAGADCGAITSGTGNAINLINVTLPNTGSIQIAVNGTVALATTGTISNTAVATLPAGVNCSTPPCTFSATVSNNNGGVPQLSIVKTATPTAFAVGQPGTYSLMVSNTGSTSTSGAISVFDPLPTGITTTGTPSGAGWNCSASTSTTINCTTATVLLPGSNAPTITAPVAIAANVASPAVNTATVSGGSDPTCPGAAHCVSTISTTINAPQINVSKSLTGTLVVGIPATYNITAQNVGQAATLAGTISDTIPTGLTIGTLPAQCTAVGQVVTCTLAAGIAPGNSVSFAIPITPQASLEGQNVTNTATASGGGDNSCPAASHCIGTVSNTVTAPQLLLTKTATPSPFVVDQPATYTLQLTNNGTAPTSQTVTITDGIPAGLTIGIPPAGCTVAAQIVTCTIPAPLSTGSPVSFVIPVTPQPSVSGQSVTNSAAATGGGDPGCPDGTPIGSLPTRCVGTAMTIVNAPVLTLQKTASSANFVVGVAASYTLQVTNTGTAATTATANVTDTIPANLTIGTLPGACTATGQQISCTVAAGLATGSPVSFVIPVTPTVAASGTTLINTATVTGGGDPTCPIAAHCTSTVNTPVDAPQLTIQKTASGPNFVVDVPGSYTLQVTNIGTAATTAITTVSDNVPSDLTIGTLPASCSAVGQQVTCTIAAGLATNSPVTFVIPVTPTDAATGTMLTNTATVTGGGDPTCPGAATCTSTVNTPVDAPQLTILKTASDSNFVVGVQSTYTLQVTNTGTAATTDIATVSDNVPGNLTLGTLPANCTATGQAITCTIAAGLATNASVSFVIPVTATAAASGSTLMNTATVTGGGDPSCPGAATCTSTVTTPVGAPQLTLQKTASDSNFVVGVPASYTLQVTNTGTAATTAPSSVSDTIPSALTIGTLPANCSGAGQMITCTIASGLATGAPVSFVIPVTPTAAASGTTVLNTATVSGGGDPTCPAAPNCTSSVSTPVSVPLLDIEKTASDTNFVVGSPASYTLTVTNVGTASTTATSTITDVIPANLIIGTPPSGCSASGQTVTCTIPSGLATGSPVSFVIPVTATASASGTTLINTATVTGGGDATCPAASHCTSSVSTPVDAPQLSIVKTASSATFAVGTAASYTLTVTNTGSAATTASATVSDNVPSQLTIDSVPGTCAASGQQVTCTIPTGLAVGANASFTIFVTPTAAANGSTLSNTATVTGGGDTDCPAASHCTSTVLTPVNAPLLTIQKSASSNTFAVGVAASYTLIVTNSGSAATSVNAIVSDTVPGNLTIGTLPLGCAASGQQITCSIPAGLTAGGSVTFVIPVTPTSAAGGAPLVNTATVSGGGDPSCPAASHCISTVTNTVAVPGLQIVKTGPTHATAGGTIVYTIAITNVGNAAVTNATLTDPAPAGLTFVSAGAPCALGFPCNLGTINPQQTITVPNVTFSIGANVSGTIVNIASVTSDQTAQTSSSASVVIQQAAATTPVPIDVRWMLLLMTLITATVWRARRASQR